MQNFILLSNAGTMQVHANCCLTGQILFRATVYVSFSLHVKRIYLVNLRLKVFICICISYELLLLL